VNQQGTQAEGWNGFHVSILYRFGSLHIVTLIIGAGLSPTKASHLIVPRFNSENGAGYSFQKFDQIEIL
jgi:hypothetical protein